jgi:hypothetical protein
MDGEERAVVAWSSALAKGWALLLVLSSGVMAVAVLLIASDSSQDDGEWDGFGTAIGLAGVVAVLPVVIVAVLMRAHIRSGRRRQEAGVGIARLRTSGVLSLAWVAVAFVVPVVVSPGIGYQLWPALLVLMAAVVVPASVVVVKAGKAAEAGKAGMVDGS